MALIVSTDELWVIQDGPQLEGYGFHEATSVSKVFVKVHTFEFNMRETLVSVWLCVNG